MLNSSLENDTGETLDLSMLHHFLAAEIYGLPTKGLFDPLKISQAGEKYTQQQGKYPVIFIPLKNIKCDAFDQAYKTFYELIREIYSEHRYLLNSSKIYPEEKRIYQSILDNQAISIDIRSSLNNLIKYLFDHHGTKPWLLIDDYDAPLQFAHDHNYFDKMNNFMNHIFFAAFKDNPYLHRAVITISKR